MAPAGGDIDNWVGLDREWRGLVVGRPPLDFATARRRFKEGWRFALREHVAPELADGEEAKGEAAKPGTLDEDCADEEVGLLALRKDGGLAIASREGGKVSVAVGDRVLVLAEPAGVRVGAEVGQACDQRVLIGRRQHHTREFRLVCFRGPEKLHAAWLY